VIIDDLPPVIIDDLARMPLVGIKNAKKSQHLQIKWNKPKQ
jgi:hypothetical protein